VNPWSRLGRLLGITPLPADVSDELAALRRQVTEFTQAELDHQRQTAALRESLDKADKQIARAGKELFKTNSLAEAQQQSVKTLVEQLREANVQRDRELTQLRERLDTAHAEGRLEVIKRLLAVLDGLDEALAAGQHLLADQAASEAIELAAPPASFSGRLAAAWRALKGGMPTQAMQRDGVTPDRDDLDAWLTGLELVHDRLLDILASEDVHPIETAGAQFDPACHVAIEAVASTDGTPPGAIVQETRRGYWAGDEILRYAEVIVAR
jgi:molecular chaperone GrpE